MKKELILSISLFIASSVTSQIPTNIRKGIEIGSPAEKGTAGTSLTSGTNNLMIGVSSGSSTTTGYDNVFIGNYTGSLVTTGSGNTSTGRGSGNNVTNGSANSFYGANSGSTFIGAAKANTCVGHRTGYASGNSNSGDYNTFVGNESGYSISFSNTSAYNTFLGAQSGRSYNGSMNTIIGATGINTSQLNFGDKITLLGFEARNSSNSFLTNATAIGANAAVSASNSMVLGNLANVGIGISNPGHTLHLKKLAVWGGYTLFSDSRTRPAPQNGCNWDNAAFIVNGDYTKAIIVGKGNSECQDNGPWTETFRVFGNGYAVAAAYGVNSDKRFKKDITQIMNSIDIVKKLNGVSYKFNLDLVNNPNLDGKETFGFIAQEVEKIIPQVIHKNSEGYYSVNYDAIIPILNNAIKEQQTQIEDIKSENQMLKERLANIEKMIGVKNEELNDIKDALFDPNPNPTNGATEISYQLSQEYSNAYITIMSLDGKEIESYKLNAQKGKASIKADLSKLASGTYLYSLVAGEKVIDTKRLQILK